MSKQPNTFQVRRPVTDDGPNVREVVRSRGVNSDVWSLTREEILSLHHTLGDALLSWPECEHEWEQTAGLMVGDVFNCKLCGKERFEKRCDHLWVAGGLKSDWICEHCGRRSDL